MRRNPMLQGLWLALAAGLPGPAVAAAFLFAGDADGPNLIAHPKGYSGTGGTITVSVCANPAGVPSGVGVDAFASSVELAVDAWRATTPSTQNLGLGADNELASSKVDLRSAIVHELGHCLGLAHPNGGSEAGLSGPAANSTRATAGLNLLFNVGAGPDGLFGSRDDLRSDDENLYWYDSASNLPLALPAVIDRTTLQRTGVLPGTDVFPANADRGVLAALGIAGTESVMQELQFFDEVQRRITAEDLRGLRLARAGLDRLQGTADDYSVTLNFTGVGTDCDIPVRFDAVSEFAQCEVTASFIAGDAIRINTARILLSPAIDWHAAVGPNVLVTPTATPSPSAPGQALNVQVAIAKRFAAGPAGEAAGTVRIDDGAGAQCTAVAANGSASCSMTPLVRGTRLITARFEGNGGFDAARGTVSHQITGPAVTSFGTTSTTPGSTVIGQPYTVAATIQSPLGPPTGSLTFADGLGASCNGTLAPSGATAATASCALPSSTPGARSVQVNYAGNTEFAAAQTTLTHTIGRASTTTTILSDDPDPNRLGVPVNVVVGLTANAPGAGTPTGTIRISASPTEFCDITLPQTSCNLAFATAGARTITAAYPGDTRFEASGDTESHQVQVAATSLVADDTPATTVVGQPYAVSASVSSSFGAPTGSVSFADELGASCNGTLTSVNATTASASCNLPSSTPGTRTIQVNYAGTALFGPAQAVIDHVVNRAATTTTIVSDDPDPNRLGEPVTVVIGVAVNAPGAGTPTGTVRVSASPTEFCDVVLPQTSCNLAFQNVGNRTLTASYPGDSRFEASQDTETHSTLVAATSITASSNPASSVIGQPYAATATISSSFGPAVGSVSFADDLGASCNATLASASANTATAGCNLPSSTPGTRTIQVSYAGNSAFAAAQTTFAHTIGKASTTTTILSDDPDPSTPGAAITVTLSVTVNAPGTGTPSGTVRISASGTEFCDVVLPQQSCSLTLTGLGSRTLTANYPGDARFEASTDTEPHLVAGPIVFQNGFEPAPPP